MRETLKQLAARDAYKKIGARMGYQAIHGKVIRALRRRRIHAEFLLPCYITAEVVDGIRALPDLTDTNWNCHFERSDDGDVVGDHRHSDIPGDSADVRAIAKWIVVCLEEGRAQTEWKQPAWKKGLGSVFDA